MSYPPPKGHCALGRAVIVGGLGWDTAEPKELATDSAATSYLLAFAFQALGSQIGRVEDSYETASEPCLRLRESLTDSHPLSSVNPSKP